MTRGREVFGGMTAAELRSAVAERQELRMTVDAMRKHLDQARCALYACIDYSLAWILREEADAHVEVDYAQESPPHHSSRPRHETEPECDHWQRATLRKIVVFARPAGVDLEALEYDVARWAGNPNTLGHLEAQKELLAARAMEMRRQFLGLRAPCPLCGGTPQ